MFIILDVNKVLKFQFTINIDNCLFITFKIKVQSGKVAVFDFKATIVLKF